MFSDNVRTKVPNREKYPDTVMDSKYSLYFVRCLVAVSANNTVSEMDLANSFCVESDIEIASNILLILAIILESEREIDSDLLGDGILISELATDIESPSILQIIDADKTDVTSNTSVRVKYVITGKTQPLLLPQSMLFTHAYHVVAGVAVDLDTDT